MTEDTVIVEEQLVESNTEATVDVEPPQSELSALREEMVSLRESIDKLSKLASAAYRRR